MIGTVVVGAVEGAPIEDILFFAALFGAIAVAVLPMVEVLARRQPLLPSLGMSLAGVSLVGSVTYDVMGLNGGWAVAFTLGFLFALALSVRTRRAPENSTAAAGQRSTE